MSSDTRYFNRSRMLPAHNKNKSHMPQPSPLSMKRSKSARKSLEMMGRRSERESRSSTPTPIDMKLPEIPKLQVLPNGQKPNFGNTSNSNHSHHHHQHHNHKNTQSHNQIHNHAGKHKDLSTSKNKNHSRRKSTSNEKSYKRSIETENDKIDQNLKKDPQKKEDKINTESTEVVTDQLKNLLINDSGKNSSIDVENSTKVKNNPSPLTTFMTSPIITPETIPPKLKIENNTILGKTLLLPSIQQNSQFINTNSQQQQQQQQFNHSLSSNPSITSKQPNNITSLPLLPNPAPISPITVNNRAPLSIINGIVNSPIIYPLTSFQMSNNVRPLPFGNTNMNYSITNTPLPMPPFVAPPLVLPQQNPLNSSNLVEAKDIHTNNLNAPLLPESISNQDMKITSNKSNSATTNENNIVKHSKNTNKKTSHSFAGASFATDIPQECNLPKPSFL